MLILMPRYDGIYGLQKILEFDPSAKVIIITCCVSEKRNQLKKIGAVDALSKPCEMDRVFGLIER
jgi:DNA-binding NtrC family response regulator